MAGESCNLNKDKADILKPPSSNSSPSSPPPSHTSPVESKAPDSLLLRSQEFPASERPEAPLLAAGATPKPAVESRAPETPVRFCNRCSSCRKRVGLTGFRCRCGELFCSMHRHSAAHDCCFDYKAAGREQIARDNPLIRAAKIIKI